MFLHDCKTCLKCFNSLAWFYDRYVFFLKLGLNLTDVHVVSKNIQQLQVVHKTKVTDGE